MGQTVNRCMLFRHSIFLLSWRPFVGNARLHYIPITAYHMLAAMWSMRAVTIAHLFYIRLTVKAFLYRSHYNIFMSKALYELWLYEIMQTEGRCGRNI